MHIMWTIQADVVTPGGTIKDDYVTIGDDGRIAFVGPERDTTPQSGDVDRRGFLLLPGFIDVHVHGGGGADFMDAAPDAVRAVLRTHARFGTTGLLATTLTASRENTDRAIVAARTVMEQKREMDCARLLGLHLEGPYICAARRGAQPPQHVRNPDGDEWAHWQNLSGGAIKRLTLAPELPGARELIEQATASGVTVSMGHTNATAEQALEAVGWGVTGATHVFNAMPPLHHREPGAVGVSLTNARVLCEVICDGVHLHPVTVQFISVAKRLRYMVLITDAMRGAGMPDGTYELGGRDVFVSDGTATFDDGTLAGSVLTMNRAFVNFCRYTPSSPFIVSWATSLNAARQLGIHDQCGTIEAGKQADMVLLHPETGDVEMTVVGGQVAYRR